MLSAVVKVLAKKKKLNCYPNETFQQLTSAVYENFVEDVCFSSPSQWTHWWQKPWLEQLTIYLHSGCWEIAEIGRPDSDFVNFVSRRMLRGSRMLSLNSVERLYFRLQHEKETLFKWKPALFHLIQVKRKIVVSKKTEVQDSILPPWGILASSEGIKLSPTKSVAEQLLARGTSPVPSCLGAVYSEHTCSEVQPKYGRRLLLTVALFSSLPILIFY